MPFWQKLPGSTERGVDGRMEVLRNLYRRRLRNGLTILGVAVGMMAFTVMGGMAEKFDLIIEGGKAYFANRIAVRSAGGSFRLNLLEPGDIEAVRAVDGVKEVETQILLPLDETAGFEMAPRFLVGVNMPDFLRAQELAGENGRLRLREGTWWHPGERDIAVLGSAVARRMNLGVGGILQARGRSFRVIGVLEETFSVPDGWVLVPQEDAREVMVQESSLLQVLGIDQFVTHAYALVDPDQGERITEAMAASLRGGFLLYSPREMADAMGQASTVLNTAILGSGAIAVIVGTLAVVNTMFIAVTERIREIGIKKAIGASRWDIVREFLLESVVIGLLGGILGVGLGALVMSAINWYTRDQGTPVFLLTHRLAGGAVAFSGFLGAVAGMVPALRAASLDPVRALREY